MKYFNFFIFFLIVLVSWPILQSKSNLPMLAHFQIQQQVEERVAEALKNKDETITKVSFSSVKTEVVNEDEIKIHFNSHLQLKDESEKKIQGYALILAQDKDRAQWKITEIKLQSNQVSFSEEIITLKEQDDKTNNQEDISHSTILTPSLEKPLDDFSAQESHDLSFDIPQTTEVQSQQTEEKSSLSPPEPIRSTRPPNENK